MKRRLTRRALSKTAALSTAAFVLGATGTAFALYNQAHENIVLKNADGVAIKATDAVNAFSIKNTCFGPAGTTGCHGDATASGSLKFSYDDIERHSYHAQLGANEVRGWNPANPDSDAWRAGAGPQGKNWVQSPGHVGSW
ncbi:MAG: cytochrome C [Geobacter sp.]|nr:cytochrome C [Geobacter sp.]